ncbi:unnamed protein product (macronuclear) [Paramecium tetraurelia]|uniref:Uncharacterized protein n=1 Tax=Paramecium tetraurelia TaxID=5888 RepID=A0D3E4_PARTE|nr:uncharacterized protein GSPATT00013047001 [Paramecium tetraurelia]CAK77561.1 unnamed protein product [Paramecium tetraurelia]|eukprot:XP_001444958.1 hypothetical protein (macronuclear) [Paramecium tetraurelia strain d4-2]
MKIFLLILFVISSGQTFLQDFHNWVQENQDLLDGFVEESKNPIDAFQLQSVQLNGKQFISLTNGWLSQETFDSSYTKQYFTIITSKLALLAVDVRENIKFVIDKEQTNPQVVMFEQENYRGMNIKTNSQNRLVIYPRVNEVVSQKQQENDQLIEFSNIEQEQFLIYIIYGTETDLRDAQNLFNFITEFIELIESKQPPKYKQCKPKSANKKKSTKSGSKQSQKKPQQSGKAGQSRGSLKDKDSNEKLKQSSQKDHQQQKGDDFNKKIEDLDDSGLQQNGSELNNNDQLRDQEKGKGKGDNESGTGADNDGLGTDGQNSNKAGDGLNDNNGDDNQQGTSNGGNGKTDGANDGKGDGSDNGKGDNGNGDGSNAGNKNGTDGDGKGDGQSGDGKGDGQGGDGQGGDGSNGEGDGQGGDGSNGKGDGNGGDGDSTGGDVDGTGVDGDGTGKDGDGINSNKGDGSDNGSDNSQGNDNGNDDGSQNNQNDNDGSNGNADQNNNNDQNLQDDNDDKNSKCVNLYSECYFSGDSIELCGSHAEITDKLQNFKIKSIEMDDGIEVSFFGESHFENQVITITDDVECLDIPIILSPTDIEELIQILK